MIRPTLALLSLATPAMADRILADASCAPMPMDLHYSCNIFLTEGDMPVEGAAFTVTPAMPSMPMAHNIPPVEAVETEKQGAYTAKLQLGMPGDWTLTLDLTSPRRDRIILKHSFAQQASESSAMDHSGQDASN